MPSPVRQRIAAAAGRLVAIEVTVASQSLEHYPWELIGDPGLLDADAANVTVWRTVTSPPLETPKRWGGSVLLAGSEAMLTGVNLRPA